MSATKTMTLSKKALGTFTLAALMSVLLIKLFSELALADDVPRPDSPPSPAPHSMPTLNAPARILGTYQITDIQQKSKIYNGSICKPYEYRTGRDGNEIKKEEPDSRCNSQVWVVRTNNQITVLKMNANSEEDKTLELGVMANKKPNLLLKSENEKLCDSTVSAELALNGLFDSKFCRGIRVDSKLCEKSRDICTVKTHDSEVFLFTGTESSSDSADAQALQGSILGMVFGIPVGIGSDYGIFLPKGQSIPASFEIVEHLSTAVLLFGKADIFRHMTLKRVAE